MGHAHNHKDNDTTQMFGIAALAAGVGALTAILFTKQNGAETREALRTKMQEFKAKPKSIKQEIDEAADNAAKNAAAVTDQVIEKATNLSDKLKDKINKN